MTPESVQKVLYELQEKLSNTEATFLHNKNTIDMLKDANDVLKEDIKVLKDMIEYCQRLV